MERASGNRVAPLSHAQLPTHSLTRLARYLRGGWNGFHTSHSGKYSIERLYAYGEYCRQASHPRVISAALLTPLPALAVILAVESVPLNSPTLGWQGNYVVFARVFVCAAAVASSLLLQAKNILPDLRLTLREACAIAVTTASAYTAVLLLLASVWVFPIPFIIVVGSVPFVCFTAISFTLTVGLTRVRQVAQQRERFVAFLKLAAIQASMTAIYPTFQAIYIQLHSAIAQIGAICVLQIIKWILKVLLASQITHGIDDYKPAIVVFSVDVFHGLYISSCMQTANSPWTKFVIIGFDIFHQARALTLIHYRTSAIQRQLSLHDARQDVVSLVIQLLQQPHRLASGSLHKVRVSSILSHPISSHSVATLATLRSLHFASEVVQTRARPSSILPKRLDSAALESLSTVALRQPVVSLVTKASETRAAKEEDRQNVSDAGEVGQQVELLEQTLELLFTCEYLALAEYVECIVPVAYAVYLLAMKALPNVAYYPQLAAMDSQSLDRAVSTILLYAALELASFLVFQWLVRRRLGVSPLHQLAFVLENQIEMVEGKLIAWVLIVLQFPLVHFGADFSFKFGWIPR